MTATVHPLESREERAARAALARMSPEQREALMRIRENVLTLHLGADSTRSTNPGAADAADEMAAELDEDVCSLLGFEGFDLLDVPPDEPEWAREGRAELREARRLVERSLASLREALAPYTQKEER